MGISRRQLRGKSWGSRRDLLLAMAVIRSMIRSPESRQKRWNIVPCWQGLFQKSSREIKIRFGGARSTNSTYQSQMCMHGWSKGLFYLMEAIELLSNQGWPTRTFRWPPYVPCLASLDFVERVARELINLLPC